MKFNETKLHPRICSAVQKAGYEEMTPIQEQAIPAVLAGLDMIACAQTGTGKTAAFALPILDMLDCNGKVVRKPRALILTPTRELAQQIFDNFKKYGRYLKLRTACIYGGASQSRQIAKLSEGYDILIATPGRLMDFESRGFVSLKDMKILVLDEADQMLDMGFIPDVRKIEKMLKPGHQTLMFSATMPAAIEELAKDLLHDPVDIRVSPTSSPAETVDQKIVFVEKENKKNVLVNFLHREDVTKSIVFTSTKHGADKLVKELAKHGIETKAISGNKTQGQRLDALQRFKSGKIKVLVATDVLSRGIDVPKVSHVFNFDLPHEAEAYIHRIGRAGRAGEDGEAITVCTEDELYLLRDIEKLIEKEIDEVKTEWSVVLERLKEHTRVPRNIRRRRNKRAFENGEASSEEGRGKRRRDGRREDRRKQRTDITVIKAERPAEAEHAENRAVREEREERRDHRRRDDDRSRRNKRSRDGDDRRRDRRSQDGEDRRRERRSNGDDRRRERRAFDGENRRENKRSYDRSNGDDRRRNERRAEDARRSSRRNEGSDSHKNKRSFGGENGRRNDRPRFNSKSRKGNGSRGRNDRAGR